MMAVLLGVYKVVKSVMFNENWKTLLQGHKYGNLNELIEKSKNETNKKEKIDYYIEHNYLIKNEINIFY